jgi:hypothetical protein
MHGFQVRTTAVGAPCDMRREWLLRDGRFELVCDSMVYLIYLRNGLRCN